MRTWFDEKFYTSLEDALDMVRGAADNVVPGDEVFVLLSTADKKALKGQRLRVHNVWTGYVQVVGTDYTYITLPNYAVARV